MKQRPRVSIGLPVRNGEQHLRAALDSLLAQTFGDFEIILSDNASTDQTESICREYAKRDDRIRYFRTKRDLGAAANFNRVFDFGRGDYFKWATHADVYAPTYLQRCAAALDDDLSAVLVQARTLVIDESGQRIPTFEARQTPFEHEGNARSRDELCDPVNRRLDSASGPARFHELLNRTDWCDELYGLVRRDVLERTRLHQAFDGEGKLLLAQLCLIGRFTTVREELFLRRLRAAQATPSTPARRNALARVRCTTGFARCVFREQMPLHERLECLAIIGQWSLQTKKWKKFIWREPKPMHQTLPV